MIDIQYTSIEKLPRVEMNRCEHERVWETRCAGAVTTIGEKETVYRAYTCAMHFCKYPEIYCRVKGHGLLLKWGGNVSSADIRERERSHTGIR